MGYVSPGLAHPKEGKLNAGAVGLKLTCQKQMQKRLGGCWRSSVSHVQPSELLRLLHS